MRISLFGRIASAIKSLIDINELAAERSVNFVAGRLAANASRKIISIAAMAELCKL